MALPETITDARAGADHRGDHVALHRRFNREFDPIVYGAVADGVADDTTAFQAAIDAAAVGGGLVITPDICKVTTLAMKPLVHFQGRSFNANDLVGGSIIKGTAGSDIITLPTTGDYSTMSFRGVTFSGGRNQIVSTNVSSYVAIQDCQFSSPSEACIKLSGQIEEWYLRDVRLSGGQYGFWFPNIPNGGGSSLIDKCVFENVLTNGQTLNGWRIECLLSGTCTWINPIINTPAQHGFYADGGITSWVFINANTEGGGSSGKKNRTTLTGTVAAAATSATLASATGWATGDGMTIAGAGASGADFTIVSTADGGPGVTISGTTVSWTGGTSTAVTTPDVTNASYDDFRFNNTIASPSKIQFLGGIIGGESGNGRLRYAANLTGAYNVSFLGVTASSDIPVYDPTLSAQIFGGALEYRAPNVLAGEVFLANTLGSDKSKFKNSQLTSPNGKPFRIVLRDSNGNTTGTYDNFSIHKYNSNRNEILRVNGTTGDLLTYGGIGPGSPTGGLDGHRIFYASAAPTSGTFVQGDIVFNTAPAAGGIPGWVCTTGGTPGTWKAMAVLAA